jgi:hypothetical protein
MKTIFQNVLQLKIKWFKEFYSYYFDWKKILRFFIMLLGSKSEFIQIIKIQANEKIVHA